MYLCMTMALLERKWLGFPATARVCVERNSQVVEVMSVGVRLQLEMC